MKQLLTGAMLVAATSLCAFAQKAFPPAALQAKTVAIVNDTHDKDLVKGAQEALKAWGRFKLTDDAYHADLTLRFDKTEDHHGASSEKNDENGKPSYGYGVTFGSSVHMKAYTSTGTEPFYVTKTGDSKQKGGMECVQQFQAAYRAARQTGR